MKKHSYLRLATFAVCISVLTTNIVDALAQEEATPFWLTPKVKLDITSLSPAKIKLVKGPESVRKFALLQTGEYTPSSNYIPSDPNWISSEDTGYHVVEGGLKLGARPYGDRKYKLNKLEAPLKGLTLLQTKMGHKTILDGRYSIVLSTTKPCYIFVVIDERALKTYKEHGTPAWLEEYKPTSYKLTTDESVMNYVGASYLVFVKQVAEGRIVLGPPCMDGPSNSMYFAFFAQAQ